MDPVAGSRGRTEGAGVDLIAFVETHLTLIASLIAVMASLGSVYMIADRRGGR